MRVPSRAAILNVALTVAVAALAVTPVGGGAAPTATAVTTVARTGPNPQVFRAVRAGVSPALRSVHAERFTPDPDVVLEIPMRPPVRRVTSRAVTEPGPLAAHLLPTADGALMADAPEPNMPAPAVNVQGVSQATQGAVSGFFVSPPDTVGDVGPNHYVQCVNLACRVFDKSGAPVSAVFTLTSLFASLGGDCATTNDGDPIVLYDPLADRWQLSQFAVANRPPAHECVAISQTGDPTGTWYVYDFAIPDNYFNDYPKFGVWPDGYYMTAPLFEGPVFGQGAFIMNRAKMLAGDPTAEMVFFDLTTAFPGLHRILPADVDGLAPPAGTANYMAGLTANEFGDPQDGIRMFEVRADWNNPAASTFTELPFAGGSLAVATYDPTFTEVSGNCGFAFTSRDDIEQPAPATCGMRVDAIADRPMHRLAYRNFGTHESMVFSHTVDVNATPSTATSGHRAGVRYYELRRALPAGSWAVQEQATFSPDAVHRFMPSAAMDAQGNIAVGYSVSDATSVFPGVRYAGRLAGDPPGGLAQGEALMAAGGRSQTSTASRWGDYSAMSVDPADECTFWYTQEYYDPVAPPSCSATACWTTRIGSFVFPGCTSSVTTGTLTGTVTDAVTALPIAGALVQANGYSAISNASGVYSMTIPTGTYTVTAARTGYGTGTATGVVVVAAGTSTQDFALGSGSLAGTVTDSVSSAPIVGATVVITPGPTLTTDATGDYAAVLPPGTYSATASATGYFSATVTGISVVTTGITTQDFALAPAPTLAAGSAVNDSLEGNANGYVDANECFQLTITVTNSGTVGLTGITGTISTGTPGVTVRTATRPFPDIPGPGAGANAEAFHLYTSPAFATGTPIDIVLDLATAQGLISLPVTVETFGGAATAFSAAGPVPIPDNNGAGAQLTIPVAGFAETLSHVAVRVRITHTFDGDLVLRLLGPDGTVVVLSYQVGGAGAGFGTDCPADGNDTTFDDTAATSVIAGTAPFVGSYRPQQALSAYAGKSGAEVNGSWQFQAIDLGPADIGNIECVTLLFNGSTAASGGSCVVPVRAVAFTAE